MILAHNFKRILGLDRFMSVELTLILEMDIVRCMIDKKATTGMIEVSHHDLGTQLQTHPWP